MFLLLKWLDFAMILVSPQLKSVYNFNDRSNSIGHGPFSHEFDSKVLKSIDKKTKLEASEVAILSQRLIIVQGFIYVEILVWG